MTRSLGESDWEDQDLLTLDEAGERLDVEVTAEQEALAVARASGDDDAVARHESRLRALTEALDRIRR